jgi:hypothetical protein
VIVEPDDLYVPVLQAEIYKGLSIGTMVDKMIADAKAEFGEELTSHGSLMFPEWLYNMLLSLRGDPTRMKYKGFTIQPHKIDSITFEIPSE